MCGIFGLIDTISPASVEPSVRVLLDVIFKRGPDGEGTYFDGAIGMGMRRLSIIDVEGGQQPFFSAGGTIVAFQNGEIYNFATLRRDLEERGYSFISHCDTEVLAHGYDAWGISGLLSRLDGMFAIAILDKRRRQLHLARDRFGEKPLFYAAGREPGRFAYGSNLVTLAALPWVDTTFDRTALARYLTLGFVPGPATICGGIRRVLPGGVVTVDLGGFAVAESVYYRLPMTAPARKNATVDEVEAVMREAVRSRLVADVPVGVFLSGGMDSSLIAHFAAEEKPQIDTFSIGFTDPGHDESPFAKQVAATVRSRHHHFIFDEDHFVDTLPEVVEALDEPLGDQACLPLFYLCREARKFVTVALSGEGGDEVFGGYSYYLPHCGPNAPSFDGLLSSPHATPSGFPFMYGHEEIHSVLGITAADATPWEGRAFDLLQGGADPLRRAKAADLLTWLPDDLLVKLDRMAMAHSLETRAPYLSPAVVGYGLSLPMDRCMTARENKLMLRALAERYLPREIWDRPKQGFILPLHDWLAGWFGRYGPAESYLREREIDGIDAACLAKLIPANFNAERHRARSVFPIVVLYEWAWRFNDSVRSLRARLAGA